MTLPNKVSGPDIWKVILLLRRFTSCLRSLRAAVWCVSLRAVGEFCAWMTSISITKLKNNRTVLQHDKRQTWTCVWKGQVRPGPVWLRSKVSAMLWLRCFLSSGETSESISGLVSASSWWTMHPRRATLLGCWAPILCSSLCFLFQMCLTRLFLPTRLATISHSNFWALLGYFLLCWNLDSDKGLPSCVHLSVPSL